MEATLNTKKRCGKCVQCLQFSALRRKARRRTAKQFKEGSKAYTSAVTDLVEKLRHEYPCTTAMMLRWLFLPQQNEGAVEELMYVMDAGGLQMSAVVEAVIALAQKVFIVESMCRDRLNELRSVIQGYTPPSKTKGHKS